MKLLKHSRRGAKPTKTLAVLVAFFLFGGPGAPVFVPPSCGDAFGYASCSGAATMDMIGDRDGDGLNDCDDRCPGQSGPTSNNGCPEAGWWRTILN